LTLFAPGGEGDHLDHRMRYAERVERDAAEVRALAKEHHIKQAIGFSRGARAIVGALAEDPSLLQRLVLVIPPGGTAAGAYSTWLQSSPGAGSGDLSAEILVVGHRGDQGHPVRVARTWAEQLGANLELLPPRTVTTNLVRVQDLMADFLNR